MAWKKVLTLEFMSSDESCTEGEKDVLVTKRLPWQSHKVSAFKAKLDEATLSEKTPLAKRQMKERKQGTLSTRPKPIGDYPVWAFQ